METPKLFAFVLMPFEQSFNDIYRLGIKETAASLGILAERVDDQIYREGILERIYRQIELADIIIADMTDKNANVFYEVGYAHAKDKLCILLTNDAADIPFDLKHRRHIVYHGSITTLRSQLTEELKWAQSELDKLHRSHIKVSMQTTSGSLIKDKFIARGELIFKFDLTNETDKPSPDIDHLYFYSSKPWTVYQDGKECSSTTSDIPGFPKRHFLSPPVQRLQRGAWAQLKFTAKKILATAYHGEQLKESYKIVGRSMLRLVTSAGNFDHEFPIDVDVDDIPF
jgi:hypothetical protein